MASRARRLDLAVTLRPVVPKGDDSEAANDVLNTVVERTLALTDELQAVASTYSDTAPTSSEHVMDLNAAISRALLKWVERWQR